MNPPPPPGKPPQPGSKAPAHEPEPYTVRENLQAIWQLRRYFLPFLIPAAGLLLLAVLQADLAATVARAGGEVINSIGAAAEPGAEPAPAAESSSTGFRSPVSYLFGRLSTGSTLNLAILLVVLLISAQVLGIAIEQFRGRVTVRFREGIQSSLVEALARERHLTRSKRSSGNTSQIFMMDASGLSGLLVFGLVRAAEDIVKLVVFVVALCLIPGGWRIAALMVPLSVLFHTAVTSFFLKRQARVNEGSEMLLVDVRNRTAEFFSILSRLVYAKGDRSQGERLLSASRASAQANRRYQLVNSIEDSVSGLLAVLALPIVVLTLSDVLRNPGDAVHAQMLVMNVLGAIAALASIPAVMASYSPSLRRVEEILDVPAVEPAPRELPALREASAPAVAVRNLTFGYPGMPRPLLDNVSFEIPAGAKVGIVADNGTGKSTLARLLVGDLQPDAGQVLVNGVDVTSWHLHWRRDLVGFLPAEPGFMRGTIEDNVLFGRARADVRDLDRALDVSGVRRMVEQPKFTDGLRTQIDGDIEQLLSTGERRKTGIARLMAGRQPIWLFDEPGAGLVPQAMVDVAHGFGRATDGRTCIIITHDPDVFRTDFVLFLEMGRLTDSGTHEELMARNASYRTLMTRHVDERASVDLQPDVSAPAVPAGPSLAASDAFPGAPPGWRPTDEPA